MKQLKTIFLGLLIFLMSNMVVASCAKNNTVPEPEPPAPPVPPVVEKPEGYPRFIVISDTHFGNTMGKGPMEKVPQALKNLTGKTPKADAVFVVGDITNNGEDWQYDQLLSVFNDKSNVPEGMPVYFLMGNHDNYSGASAANRYLSKIKQPLHQYITIKGYPFITVSETGPGQNDFNTAAVKFLSDSIAKAVKDYPGKPVFVFIHVPTVNTSYGSWVSGAFADGGWSTDAFKSVLDKYPQAVVFSGHTHYPLGDPRSIYQDKFTAVNTASTTYSEVEANIGLTIGTLPAGHENITEGLIVTVKENGDVELERWDTYRNEEIVPRWLLSSPHDGTAFAYRNRTGGSAPSFGDNDKPVVKNILPNSCSVSFPQASDDEVVHHYKIEILDGDNVIGKHTVFSGFYLNSSMPDSLTVDIGELPVNRSYTVRVTAYDSYRQASSPISISVEKNEEPEGYPQFIIISDTHFGNTMGAGPMVKVPKALKNLTNKAPKADAVFVVGDITNNGEDWQYDQLLSVFNDKSNVPEGMPVYFLMGNHDNYSGASAANRYLSKIKQPLHQYITIKGYPFITVSETGPGENDFNTGAVNFLSDNMAKAARDCPGKPVFVFIHIPTVNTSYGSWVSGPLADGGWSTGAFKLILDKYPQAVVFSGHTHYPLGDPRSIYQDKFTAVNTASTTYSEVEANIGLNIGTLPAGHENITEGLIATVKENGDVELERWDTYRNEEIVPRWLINAPHDGTAFAYKNRTGGSAPSFGDNDKPVVKNILPNSCSVSFPQASDDEVVHHYKIEILDGDNVVDKHTVFSGFYFNSSMPDSLTVTLYGMSINNSYTAKVTAYDSYRQASSPIISPVFQTGECITTTDELPQPVGVWTFEDETNPVKATTGADLEANGNFTFVEGPNGTKAVKPGTNSFFTVHHNIGANGGGNYVNEYTLMMDIRDSDLELRGWLSLFNSSEGNSGEGVLWINSNGMIGYAMLGGYSSTGLARNTWHRVVIAAKLGESFKVYIDGSLAFMASNNTNIDGKISLYTDVVYIGADGAGYQGPSFADVRMWNVQLTDCQIYTLGKPN